MSGIKLRSNVPISVKPYLTKPSYTPKHMSASTTSLRELTQNSLSNEQIQNAIFFGNKLIAFSQDQDDIYLLSKAYFLSKEYNRAYFLISSFDLIDKELKFKYLAALCKVSYYDMLSVIFIYLEICIYVLVSVK